MWLTGIVLFLFIAYAFLILFYTKSWKQIPLQAFSDAADQGSPVTFSVIIPARNEAAVIVSLLESIKKQSYSSSLFEVIVVDDHSTDQTAALVQQLITAHSGMPAIRLISLDQDALNSYKKKAIETGIAAARNQWIVCTDAGRRHLG